jgi:hypothetical protein
VSDTPGAPGDRPRPLAPASRRLPSPRRGACSVRRR